MKKFMIAVIILVVCAIGLYYSVYYGGLYIPSLTKKEAVTVATTKGKKIYLEDGKPFVIKGVDVSASLPGYYASDYMVDEDMWYEWFTQIQNMGANTVRTYNIYNDAFYNAFYKYNKDREEPLYLLQGIQVSDYANNCSEDAYHKDFYFQLKESGRSAVDVIHGKKTIKLNKYTGSGKYRRDVSEWVIGYIVGNNWNSGTIAYTNNNGNKTTFDGKYFKTGKNADAFEALLADVMDSIVIYERNKYNKYRLITFTNEPLNDPFEYDEFYARQLGKYNCIDPQNIEVKNDEYSGYFASYMLYDFCPEFASCFSEEQKRILGDKLNNIGSYTSLLAKYHTMPVVIAGYGVSSARGSDTQEGPYTEVEQGIKLLEMYDDITKDGCQGAFIQAWQDCWERIYWNTSYGIDLSDNKNWHDVQNVSAGTGILTFVPGTSAKCYVDGKLDEWESKTPLIANDKLSMSVMYDAQYYYIMLKGEGISAENKMYIPIDTLTGQGSKVFEDMRFSHSADFVICLDGEKNSRILVHERYDSIRQNYQENIDGTDPYEECPDKAGNKFVPMRMLLKKVGLRTPEMVKDEQVSASYFKTYETGKLLHGSSNVNSVYYNSLADFCYGLGCVEIRIPWSLINFSNPSEMMIHKDYYQHYGRESQKAAKICIGAGFAAEKENAIEMKTSALKGWGTKVKYTQRLKQSYYILQEGWR